MKTNGWPAGPPLILLVDGSYWPCSARLAIRFAAFGARIVAICPRRGHPLPGTTGIARVHEYPVDNTAATLVALIDRERPDFIVACDDNALCDLQQAHAYAEGQPDAYVAKQIEHCLGDPHGFPFAFCRNDLIALAERETVRAVPSRALAHEADLARWQSEQPFPFVLKRDRTTGGDGVAVVSSPAEALAAFRRLSRPLDLAQALKRRIVNKDRFAIRSWHHAEPGRISAQPFVAGRPGNCAVACWEGAVIGFLAVEVLHTRGATGAATIVRLIDSEPMRHAAQQIVRRLGLSGFCGFDFIIEAGTGAVSLIEMNARVTALCTLAAGTGGDMVAALMSRITGTAHDAASIIGENPQIAYFPQAWQHGAPAELLQGSHHDIPWADPGLIRRLCESPYPTRGRLARLIAMISGKPVPLPVDATQFASGPPAQDKATAARPPPPRIVASA